MRKPLRFRTFLPTLALLIALPADAQNVGISADGATPDAKAVLDVNVSSLATKRGMLIPRINRVQRVALEATLGLSDDGLWVYQTDDGSPYEPANAHGFFVFNSTTDAFERMSVGRVGWGLRGNSYANTSTYYLGTASATPAAARPFILRSVSPATPAPQLFIDGSIVPTGFVGLNNATPVERLDVAGGVRVTGASLGNTEGAIVYGANGTTPALDWHYGNVDGTAAGWRRMENAEILMPSSSYPKDTLSCPTTPSPGVVVRGSVSGSSTVAPFHTTFSGEPPYLQRGFRAQYIFRADELTAAGLCQGPITGIGFNCLANEDPNVQLLVQLRIGHTALTQFAGATTFDNAVQASDSVFSGGVLLATGPVSLDFNVPGNNSFTWNGVSNIVLDIGWQRNSSNGLSPAIATETMGYNACRYYNVATNAAVTYKGWYIDDNPVSAGVTSGNFGTMTQRPVLTIKGSVKTTSYINRSAPYVLYSGAIMLDSAATASDTWTAANFKGPGTIRARRAAFDGTTQLSDHVFDRYYDGVVKAEDRPAAAGYNYVGLPELKNYLSTERHLPNMPSRAEWDEHGTRPLGELQTGLWETVETQALHIIELERDLSALETLAFGKDLDATQLDKLIAEIQGSGRLTEQQKLHLTDALRNRADRSENRK